MKTDHSFVAERALANHCPELVSGKARDASSDEQDRDEFMRGLCQLLAKRLQGLLGGKTITATAEAKGAETAFSLSQSIGPRAANYVLECGSGEATFAISFDLGTAIALTDRLFGGDGERPEGEIEVLPPSAALVLRQIVDSCAPAFAEAGDIAGDSEIIAHHLNFARLEPFPRKDYCLSWEITFAQENMADWQLLIAVRQSEFDELVRGSGRGANGAEDVPIDQLGASFEDIPVPMRAVLTEFKLPLARLASLAPSDVIPISPLREVPLRCGAKTLARGRIGTLDERVALRISRLHKQGTEQ